MYTLQQLLRLPAVTAGVSVNACACLSWLFGALHVSLSGHGISWVMFRIESSCACVILTFACEKAKALLQRSIHLAGEPRRPLFDTTLHKASHGIVGLFLYTLDPNGTIRIYWKQHDLFLFITPILAHKENANASSLLDALQISGMAYCTAHQWDKESVLAIPRESIHQLQLGSRLATKTGGTVL